MPGNKKAPFLQGNGAFRVSIVMPWEALRLIFGEGVVHI